MAEWKPDMQGPIVGDGDPDQRGQFVADPADSLEVPQGNIDEVKEWMGTDKTRAKAVVKSEGKDGRQTLIQSAQRVLDEETGAGIASGEA
jgi:hypothetical protein